MNAVVMKFGGTSVADATAIHRLINHVVRARELGDRPVVVVSALGGVTNELFRAASVAAAGDEAAGSILEGLKARHLELTAQVSSTMGDDVTRAITQQFDELHAVVRAIMTLKDASPRALDAIAAAGELLSSRIVHSALSSAGVPSVWVDPRRLVITNDDYTQASPVFDAIDAAVPRELGPELSSNRVPVTAGYVGATRDGVSTTLGRGGSDYSAALIGAALRAREIQIWTDVDGMLTADPRIVSAPQVVRQLSFGEASELAYFGAKVLHPSTILPAVARDIPVRILNSRHTGGRGTLIASHEIAGGRDGIAAIACKRGITVIDITSTRMLMAYGFLRRVFEVFERHRTSVDVVTTSEVSVSVTVDDDRRLKAVIADVSEFAEVRSESGMAILCAVGDVLRQDAHLAARILGALDGFPLRMVSQAASRRNVTVVLRDSDVPSAMSQLHDLFFAETENDRAQTETVSS
ncbi:MAG: lysine-sensitive aspartokinase 3 [Vicinamibacterales bacterium]